MELTWNSVAVVRSGGIERSGEAWKRHGIDQIRSAELWNCVDAPWNRMAMISDGMDRPRDAKEMKGIQRQWAQNSTEMEGGATDAQTAGKTAGAAYIAGYLAS